MKTIMGIFPNLQSADGAYADLLATGFNNSQISAISKDANIVKTQQKGMVQNTVAGGATGAVTGSAVGGLAGILLAAGVVTIPGLGALLIGGPIVAALGLSGAAATVATTAITGAAAGGILGSLTGLGMPEETAKIYTERISAGNVVLSVNVEDADVSRAESILTNNNANSIVAVSGR